MKILNNDISVLDFIPPLMVRSWRKIKTFIEDPKSKNKAKTLHPYISPSIGSYSQFNEDLLIDLLFGLKSEGMYLDIGANDPTFNNNMKRFYDRGWFGINIEPGMDSIKKFYDVRTRDVNLNIGVGPERGKITFYQIVEDSTLSSFNEKIARKMAKEYGFTVQEKGIVVLRLEDVFTQHAAGKLVDFMSVDAEGLDLEVLQSNNWGKFRPSLIMVEIDNQFQSIFEFMDKCNYLLVYNNYHNGIFIDNTTSERCLKEIIKKDINNS